MNTKSLFEQLFQDPCFKDSPPVFLDIGASGPPDVTWAPIAPYSVCIAFDADARDFKVESTHGWKKRYAFNCIATPESSQSTAFYLTRSPHCSSTLEPNKDTLSPWLFHPLFDVIDIATLPAISLTEALKKTGYTYIDVFKSDSQGTDLRLFLSLPTPIQETVLVAEFEPGILSAYKEEDKLHQVMAAMDALPFWVSDMEIKGTQRIQNAHARTLNKIQHWDINSFLKPSPGWCEISYMTTLTQKEVTKRQCLLAWVFATLKEQHGFALYAASLGKERYQTSVFDDLLRFSRQHIQRHYPRLFMSICKRALRSQKLKFWKKKDPHA